MMNKPNTMHKLGTLVLVGLCAGACAEKPESDEDALGSTKTKNKDAGVGSNDGRGGGESKASKKKDSKASEKKDEVVEKAGDAATADAPCSGAACVSDAGRTPRDAGPTTEPDACASHYCGPLSTELSSDPGVCKSGPYHAKRYNPEGHCYEPERTFGCDKSPGCDDIWGNWGYYEGECYYMTFGCPPPEWEHLITVVDLDHPCSPIQQHPRPEDCACPGPYCPEEATDAGPDAAAPAGHDGAGPGDASL